MQTPIVVVGAAGRMGMINTRFVREDKDCVLVGRVENESRVGELAPIEGCVDGSDLDAVLSKVTRPVIIDFTAPSYSLVVAETAAKHGAGHVIGTTGITPEQQETLAAFAQKTPIFLSPNMSLGVHAVLKILPELVRLLGEDYDMEMLEIHHNKKKDSPSGTALRLAETMLKARNWTLEESACYHREGIVGERPHKEMGLQALRGGDVVGVHTAYFFGPGERIEVTHQAHSRDNFGQGALRAAKWLAGQKPGKIYGMDDLL